MTPEKARASRLAQAMVVFLAVFLRFSPEQAARAEFIPKSERMALTGRVISASDETATIQTEKAEITINLKMVSKDTAIAIRAALGSAKPFTTPVFSVWAVAKRGYFDRAHADCTETPISHESLVETAKAAPAEDMISFLRKIPRDTLQSFTLVYESNSLQKLGVTKQWPRVIRFSKDSKLILSYTCNPESPNYGTVEMIRFDDKQKHYKFSELDFRSRPVRFTDQPKSCNSCHSAPPPAKPDPRPNWQSYSTWKGVYGMIDDRMYEREDFEKFRAMQKDNPCYSSLPWLEKPKPGREWYPYSDEIKGLDYTVRPNLKLSDFNGHLMGQRLARKFNEDPRYRRLRFLMVMDAIGGCGLDVDREIKALLPAYKPPRPSNAEEYITMEDDNKAPGYMDPRTAQSRAFRLFAVGNALGFADMDWTLTFNRPDDPTYVPGAAKGNTSQFFADTTIPALTQGQLLATLGAEAPELKPLTKLSRGIEGTFGKNFSCIDDLGGEIEYSPEQKVKLCKILLERHEKAKQEIIVVPKIYGDVIGMEACQEPKGLEKTFTPLVSEVRTIKNKTKLISMGKKIVENSCKNCHSPDAMTPLPKSYQFFSNEERARAKFHSKGSLADLADRLKPGRDRMPPPPAPELSFQEQEAVKAYIESLRK